VKRAMTRLGEIHRLWTRYMAVNCWHLNDHESAAMWRLYLKSNEGIAIQSTYGRLKDCFRAVQEPIHIGKVEYLDYYSAAIQPGNYFTPFVSKRISFEHEREVRALLHRPPIVNHRTDFSVETIQGGVPVPVDITTLIEKICVAPTAPVWTTQLVRSVISQYGYAFEVNQSVLNRRPLF
jgi:hypothetical protein